MKKLVIVLLALVSIACGGKDEGNSGECLGGMPGYSTGGLDAGLDAGAGGSQATGGEQPSGGSDGSGGSVVVQTGGSSSGGSSCGCENSELIAAKCVDGSCHGCFRDPALDGYCLGNLHEFAYSCTTTYGSLYDDYFIHGLLDAWCSFEDDFHD